jgi:hypothetical protein
MLQAMMAQRTGECPLVLLTIAHADLPGALRVTSDRVATVSRGQTFQPYPFAATLPDDVSGQAPSCSLTIDNVQRDVVQILRQVSTPPTVTIEVVLASDPDRVQKGPYELSLRRAQWNALTVTGELGYEALLDEAAASERFTPNLFPALF